MLQIISLWGTLKDPMKINGWDWIYACVNLCNSGVLTNQRHDRTLLGFIFRSWQTPEGRLEYAMKNWVRDSSREKLEALADLQSECLFIYTNLSKQSKIHVATNHRTYHICLKICVIFLIVFSLYHHW